MKNKVILTAILLVVSLGTYTSVIADGSIRTVEFISIMVIGALAGILLNQIFSTLKDKKRVG